ncbi:MAG: hypothetical protein K6B14_01945 [Lachnospiraceae bacterium]|nr:hypothetical protein [Lachnospiraceae bacterium]
MNKVKKDYIAVLGVFGLIVFFTSCQWRVRSYNTTMLALDYKNGFTSRALLGTIYHILDGILPFDMICYPAAFVFALIMTLLFLVLILFFAHACLKRADSKLSDAIQILLLMFIAVSMSTFSGGYNFLRVDIFMLAVSMLGALCIISKKAEFLVIPMSAIGVMFHQGYVFMYFNIILVLLVARFIDAQNNRDKIRYGVYFAFSFLVGSVLFLYFELFSRNSGEEVYETVVAEAEALSYNGIYHTTLLAHEVLGIDLGDTEKGLRLVNRIQFPIYILVMIPFIVFFIIMFAGIFSEAKRAQANRFKYLCILVGPLTMLPDFLLKVDYGRWVMSVVAYYFVVLLALLAMRDAPVESVMARLNVKLSARLWSYMLLAYPVFFLPYWDVDICEAMRSANRWLADVIPHLYRYVEWW